MTSPPRRVESRESRRALRAALLAVIALPLAVALLWSDDRTPRAARLDRGTAAATLTADAELAPAEPVAATVRSTLEPVAHAASSRTPVARSVTSSVAFGPPCTLRGRVIVAPGHSPEGLVLTLRLAIPPRTPIVLGDDGAFEWTDLAAGSYAVDASGLDDVAWRPERLWVTLRRGALREVEWNLADRCPAIADVQVLFDGVAARGTVQPRFGTSLDGWFFQQGPQCGTDPAGRIRIRAVDEGGRWKDDDEVGALALFCSNVALLGEPPAVVCVGQPSGLAMLRKRTREELVVDVRTTLVRVLPPLDGALPEPDEDGKRRCAITATTHVRTTLSGWQYYPLARLELDASRSPLAEFRAGPGTYDLRYSTAWNEREATVVVTGSESAVECRLPTR